MLLLSSCYFSSTVADPFTIQMVIPFGTVCLQVLNLYSVDGGHSKPLRSASGICCGLLTFCTRLADKTLRRVPGRLRRVIGRRRSSVVPVLPEDSSTHLRPQPSTPHIDPVVIGRAGQRASLASLVRRRHSSVADSAALSGYGSDGTVGGEQDEVRARRLLLAVMQTALLDFAYCTADMRTAHPPADTCESCIVGASQLGPRFCTPGLGRCAEATADDRRFNLHSLTSCTGARTEPAASVAAGDGFRNGNVKAKIMDEIMRIADAREVVKKHILLTESMVSMCRHLSIERADECSRWKQVVDIGLSMYI